MNAIVTEIKNPGPQGLFVTFNAQTTVQAASNQVTVPFVFNFHQEVIALQARLLVDGEVVPYAPGNPIVNLDSLVEVTSNFSFPPNGPEFLTYITQHGGNRSLQWIVPSTTTGDHTVAVQIRFVSNTPNFGLTFNQVVGLVGAKECHRRVCQSQMKAKRVGCRPGDRGHRTDPTRRPTVKRQLQFKLCLEQIERLPRPPEPCPNPLPVTPGAALWLP